MIQLEHVSFSYESETPVLKDLSFRIAKGETVGLIGANGAGKSTVMKALLGLLTTEGRITVGGTPVQQSTLPEIRRRLGFVLQNSDHQMFMPTVYEDMIFAPLNYGLSPAEAEGRADDALKLLGLESLKHRHNHKISGGEKRMAAIATILAMNPEAILMDEPTSALDPYNRRIVIHTIRTLRQTKLIASHDLDMILDRQTPSSGIEPCWKHTAWNCPSVWRGPGIEKRHLHSKLTGKRCRTGQTARKPHRSR